LFCYHLPSGGSGGTVTITASFTDPAGTTWTAPLTFNVSAKPTITVSPSAGVTVPTGGKQQFSALVAHAVIELPSSTGPPQIVSHFSLGRHDDAVTRPFEQNPVAVPPAGFDTAQCD
jgi:hypothetical protein